MLLKPCLLQMEKPEIIFWSIGNHMGEANVATVVLFFSGISVLLGEALDMWWDDMRIAEPDLDEDWPKESSSKAKF